MNILCACEESQAVTKELRRLGHNAFSCDIQTTSGEHKEWHILGDVIPILNGNCNYITEDGTSHYINGKWDMIIAFPPCTDLAVSGARHFDKKRADGRQLKAIKFFEMMLNADCDRIAVENPVNIIGGDTFKSIIPSIPIYLIVLRLYSHITLETPARKQLVYG